MAKKKVSKKSKKATKKVILKTKKKMIVADPETQPMGVEGELV